MSEIERSTAGFLNRAAIGVEGKRAGESAVVSLLRLAARETPAAPHRSTSFPRHDAASFPIVTSVLAAALLIMLAPGLALLGGLIWLVDGRPILYHGDRLGKHKRVFRIYKFRTLRVGAENGLQGDLVNHRHALETRLGPFLRASRLDELPQLANIIRGEMGFIGPRPVRPAVYERHCTRIPGYDRRFLAPPGLLGPSQLFTPHSTPKRIRALIDNRHLARRNRLLDESLLIVVAGGRLVWNSLHLLVKPVLHAFRRWVGRGALVEERVLQRVRIRNGSADIDGASGPVARGCRLVDMNEEMLLLAVDKGAEIPAGPLKLKLHVALRRVGRGLKRKRKTACCEGRLHIVRPAAGEEAPQLVVVAYHPSSDLHAYMIDQYFLRKSIL